MKKIIRIIAFICIAATIVSFAGCLSSKPEAKTFEKGGLKITLDDSFISSVSADTGNLTFMSYSTGNAVVAKKEAFSRLEELKYDTEKMTVKEYAELIVNDNKFDTEIKEDGTFVYFEHVIKNTDDADETFKYFSAVYKSDEAFWLIHFGCTEENYDTNRESFATYAKSVSFQ